MHQQEHVIACLHIAEQLRENKDNLTPFLIIFCLFEEWTKQIQHMCKDCSINQIGLVLEWFDLCDVLQLSKVFKT